MEAPDNTAHETGAPVDKILRFRSSERWLHWSLAVPFLVCLGTAAILVAFYNLHPERPFRAVFSWSHRASATCLIFLPLVAVLRHRHDRDIFVYNIRQAWVWTRNDLKWLLLMGPATFDKRIELPHQGKFNAAEKINFITLTITYPLFIATGLLIWFAKGSMVAWLAHIAMALNAVPLIGGHIFMATVNKDTRGGLSGMLSGYVDRSWARHHYRKWYDEHFGHEAVPAPAREASDAPEPAVESVFAPASTAEAPAVGIAAVVAASVFPRAAAAHGHAWSMFTKAVVADVTDAESSKPLNTDEDDGQEGLQVVSGAA